MKNYKAFTFVELLLVMLVLGIIITLTMPILKNIKDDEDIYRSYMKKANQDITDAAGMISIKNPRFTGFDMLANTGNASNKLTANCNGLRYAFNLALNTFYCGYGSTNSQDGNSNDKDYMSDHNKYTTDDCTYGKEYTDIDGASLKTGGGGRYSSPGLVLAGKPVMIFQYYKGAEETIGSEDVYGYIYVDMNKDKGPNEPCKDRYRFIVFKDRVAMDTREHYACNDHKKEYAADSGCGFDLSKACTADLNAVNH